MKNDPEMPFLTGYDVELGNSWRSTTLGCQPKLAVSTLPRFAGRTKLTQSAYKSRIPRAMKSDKRMLPIRMILSDVDGVLTDGAITYDNQGIESKSFHVRDGMGIKLWQRAGHRFGILTARTSHIVKVRMAEIGVELVRQGIEEKFTAAKSITEQLGMTLEEVCYIGDDLGDLRLIKAAGLGASVADAAEDVRKAADVVTTLAGGKGAMRELIEAILKQQKRWDELLGNYD